MFDFPSRSVRNAVQYRGGVLHVIQFEQAHRFSDHSRLFIICNLFHRISADSVLSCSSRCILAPILPLWLHLTRLRK